MMKTTSRKQVFICFCLLAGLMDVLSGGLLLVAPVFALELMTVPPVASETTIFIRFIGAFVFSVGSLYLFSLVPAVLAGQWAWMWGVLAATAWVRAVVCIFTTAAVFGGALSSAWWSVPATDGALAAFQLWVIWKGWLPRHG